MIPIHNIYYMLSYAFQILREQEYRNIATEQFENVADLCAAILIKGVSAQVKRGLRREYVEKTEPLSSLRGRIELSESIKTRSVLKRQLVCSFDDYSENTYMNRIIKTTMMILIRSDIAKIRKKAIRRLLLYFANIEPLNEHGIDWHIHFNQNTQTYRMLISVCYLVHNGLLQTNSDGTMRMMDFLDEQHMSRLYEKFILEYYRKEYPKLSANASRINWALDDGEADMLPVMKSDITLTHDNRTMIIDAKYYSHTLQSQYNVSTLHSGNLYQIFAYVKNKDAEMADEAHEVAGMLLYAHTDEMVQPDNTYLMSGNRISVRTLDLDCDFSGVKKQLNRIVEEYFGDVAV